MSQNVPFSQSSDASQRNEEQQSEANAFLSKLWDVIEKAEPARAEDSYCDARGQKIANPATSEGRVFCFRNQDPGCIEVLSFASGPAALAGQLTDRCVLRRTVCNGSITLQENYFDARGVLSAGVTTTLDADGKLRVDTSIAGERRVVEYSNGRFVGLSMEAAGSDGQKQSVRFSLNDAGRVTGVTVVGAGGIDIKPEPARERQLMQAATTVLDQVARQYNLRNGAAEDLIAGPKNEGAFLSVADVMSKLKMVGKAFDSEKVRKPFTSGLADGERVYTREPSRGSAEVVGSELRQTPPEREKKVIPTDDPLSRADVELLISGLLDKAVDDQTKEELFTNLQKQFSKLGGKAVDTASRRAMAGKIDSALLGLWDAIESSKDLDPVASDRLAKLYLQLAGNPNNILVQGLKEDGGDRGRDFEWTIDRVSTEAARGNSVCLKILCGLSGGIGRQNLAANPSTVDHVSGKPVDTSELAKRCAGVLLKIAEENPILRQQIAAELRADFKRGESPDNACKLFVLGAVCGLDEAPLPDDVRELLLKKLDDKSTHLSALRGLLATSAKLENADLSMVVSKLQEGDIPLLVGSFKRLGGDQAVTVLLELESRAVDKWGKTRAEDRIVAIRALGELAGEFTSAGIIEGLSLLGGPEGAKRIREQLLSAEPLTPDSKARIEKDIPRIQKEAALALLRITELTGRAEMKSDAFVAFSTSRWCKGIEELDSLAFGSTKGRVDKLLQTNPENVTIQQVGPKLLYSSRALVPTDETKDAAAAARLAGAFRDQGAQGNDSEALDSAKSAIGNYGLRECQEVSDRLAFFNALPESEKRKLTAFDEDLSSGTSYDMSGKSVSAATFQKLSKEVQLQLVDSEDACQKALVDGVSNLDKKTISAGAFNRLSPELRKELSGSEDKLEEPQELFLQGRRMSSEVFNALPQDARIRLTGSADKLPEEQRVVFDEKQSLSAKQMMALPRAVREQLLGGAELDFTKSFSLKGKSLDANVFNQLNPTERYWLTGSSSTVQEKVFVPDLATVRLSADDFNSIRPDLRRALGLPDFDLKAGQSVSLAGLSIPAEHFNLLPESVRKAITGSTGRLPDGRVVKDLSGLSISAEEFNSLSLSRRREVSATVTAISATAVFLRLADGSLAERTFAGRVLASDSGLEKKVDESKSAAAAKVEKEKARLKKLIEQEEAAQKFVTEQSKVGVGLLNKVGDRVNREVFEGQSEFIQKQNEGLFALGSLSKLIAEQRRVVAEAEAGVAVFEVAVRNREYVQAVRQGRVQFADKLAMEALTKCGALILLAPDLSQALFSTGQGIEAPVASRMYDAGLCQSPGLYQGAPDAEPSFSRGVEILTKITKPGFYSPEGQLLPYGYEDTPWLMQQGLLQIERDPAYAGMISRLEQISKSSSDLQPLISALRQNGDKFSEFIERSQTLGFEIKANLCLPDADKKKLYEMRAELKKLIDSPEKLAPEVLEQLKLRFKAIDRGLMVLDPEYDARKLHPRQFERREELIKLLEQSTPRWDKKWDAPPKDDPLYKALGERYDSSAATHLYWLTKHEEYQKELLELNAEYFPRYALQKAVDFLARPESISESDFENWVVTDGVEIAFTLALVVAATAIIIASGGTATPIVLVAAGAALMAVGGHEFIRELQYQNGIRSEGSRFGDFSRGKMIEECGYDRPMELGRDVVQPLAAEFAFEFALNLVCAGVGEGLGSLGGKALAAAERILPQNARLFAKTTELFAKFECAAAREAGLKRFMMILAKETMVVGRNGAS